VGTTISHMEIGVSTSACSFVIDGTRGGASDGKLNFTYSNTTGALDTSGGNLHIYKVQGCLGLVDNGDPVKITTGLTVSPKQTITIP
jgi:hypothetical protein